MYMCVRLFSVQWSTSPSSSLYSIHPSIYRRIHSCCCSKWFLYNSYNDVFVTGRAQRDRACENTSWCTETFWRSRRRSPYNRQLRRLFWLKCKYFSFYFRHFRTGVDNVGLLLEQPAAAHIILPAVVFHGSLLTFWRFTNRIIIIIIIIAVTDFALTSVVMSRWKPYVGAVRKQQHIV